MRLTLVPLVVSVLAGPYARDTTTKPIGEIALSPDGRRLAWIGPAGAGDDRPPGLMVADIGERTPPRRVAIWPNGGPHDLAWSPDGSRLAFVASGPRGEPGVYVAPVGGSEGPRRITDFKGLPAALEWAPDGKRLAFLIIQNAS